jgi:glyoxylase-like metal-dependent hydrolase (beta-lactamase superfamily II)
MHIQSIPMWTGTSDNYAYLVIDENSKDAVIIDPANPDEWVHTERQAQTADLICIPGLHQY